MYGRKCRIALLAAVIWMMVTMAVSAQPGIPQKENGKEPQSLAAAEKKADGETAAEQRQPLPETAKAKPSKLQLRESTGRAASDQPGEGNTDRVLYLTFDDGPSGENTEAVLDALKERNCKATFFLIGEYVEKYPETAARIAEEGHTIGIHCNVHDYGLLYQSAESYVEDFEKAYHTIYEVTGVKAELFRFPGGSVNAYNKQVCREIIREMTKRGFVYFDWNASLEDAVSGNPSPGQLIENAKETALSRNKVVLLAHDRVANTALCLPGLLDAFADYEMRALSPSTDPVQFRLPE